MLSGAMPLLSAGSTNSPPDSHSTPPLECVGTIGAVDYLSCVFECSSPFDTIDKIEVYIDVAFECSVRELVENESGSWIRIRGSSGSSVEFKYISVGKFAGRLCLGGQCCHLLSSAKITDFLRWVRCELGGAFTRIDMKADDLTGLLSLSTIRSHLESGNYMGFRGGEAIQSYGGPKAGETVYFGGRKSLIRLRFYDKEAESKGTSKGIRQELQLRGARADEAVGSILSGKWSSICEYVRSRLSGAIVFGERKGKNLERSVRAEFWIKWQEFLGVTPTVKSPIAIVKSVSRTLDWLARTVTNSLAKAMLALGVQDYYKALDIMLQKGLSRMKPPEIHECNQFSSKYLEGELTPRLIDMELFC